MTRAAGSREERRRALYRPGATDADLRAYARRPARRAALGAVVLVLLAAAGIPALLRAPTSAPRAATAAAPVAGPAAVPAVLAAPASAGPVLSSQTSWTEDRATERGDATGRPVVVGITCRGAGTVTVRFSDGRGVSTSCVRAAPQSTVVRTRPRHAFTYAVAADGDVEWAVSLSAG